MKQFYTMVALATTSFSLAQANLPFTFTAGKSSINTTEGLSEVGLGSDYTSDPKLKFDTTNDALILHFNQAAETLTFNIKHNKGAVN